MKEESVMASILKKGSGYAVRVSWYDENGNRKFKNKAGF